MAFILSTFLLALQITFYYTEAMPTGGFIKMPDDCNNQTFCTSDTDYPQANVDYLLKDKNEMSFSISVHPNNRFPTKLGDRQGIDEINEIYPCEAVPEKKEIRYIIDEQNNVRVVAQSVDRFMQYVPITSCKSPKPTTENNMVLVDLVDSYNNIECKEDKFDFNFVVLSSDLKSLEMARVKGGVPVGCQCRYVE